MTRHRGPWVLLLAAVLMFNVNPIGAAPKDNGRLPPVGGGGPEGQRGVQFVDVGGRKLALRCQGEGSPTVILEAGLTAGALTWQAVQSEVAEFTRVCSYDRANLGRSDPAEGPRTAQDAADDLSALLSNAQISAPYILVGASFGGHIVRLFAAQHPGEVASIVLVDASHEDQEARMEAVLTPTQLSTLNLSASRNTEQMDLAASDEEVRKTGPLPTVSLVVISAGRNKPVPPGFPANDLNRVWRQLQKDLTRLSDNSVQLFARKSEHDIAIDEPELVVEGIHLAYDAYREGKPVAAADSS
jgi:pimeloyl-ACP methyl ester carboxylesterase